MNHICRRRLTAFSSQPVPIDHIDRCQKQKATNIAFSWKDHLKFEDHYKKIFYILECMQISNVITNLKTLQSWLRMTPKY